MSLIVVLHFWLMHLLYWVSDGAVMVVILDVITWTQPLRIPLFFFVSGYLAAKSLGRGWRQSLRGRALAIGYLYALWLAITATYMWIESLVNDRTVVNPIVFFLQNLALPQTHLWYLWALVVLYLAVWTTRRAPTWLTIALAMALSITAPFFLEQPYLQVGSATVFYVLGARLPALARWLTSQRRLWVFLLGSAIYVTSMLLGPTAPYGLSDPLTSTVGVISVVAAIAGIADQRWIRIFRLIGRNTLPIFILNPFVFIALNYVFLSVPDIPEWATQRTLTTALYSCAVVTGTIAGSIGVKLLADRIGWSWLFQMPSARLRVKTQAA